MRYFFAIASLLVLPSTVIAAGSSGAKPENMSAQDTVQVFLAKILNEKFENRFGLNKAGQFAFLSLRVQKLVAIAECDCAKAYAEEGRPLPWVDAEMFFDRWDTPTSCTAMPSSSAPPGMTVPVTCTWGENKDHLPGTKLQIFVRVVDEAGKWKIDDVVHGRQEKDGETKTTFVQRLIEAGNQSTNPKACKKTPL